MKDIDKRARIFIVRSALEHLLALEGAAVGFNKKQLFGAMPTTAQREEYDVTDAAVVGQRKQTAWLNAAIDRLIDYKLLFKALSTENDKIWLYSYDDKFRISSVLKDADNGGVHLSWFIFPGEVPGGEPHFDDVSGNSTQDVEDLLNTDTTTETPADLDEDKGRLASLLVGLLKQVLGTVDQYKADYEKYSSELKASVNAVLTESKSIKARVTKMESRLTTVEKQSQSTQVFVKEAASSLDSMTAVSSSVQELLTEIKSSGNAVMALKDSVDGMAARLKVVESGKATELAARLNSSTRTMLLAVEEQEQLRKDILEYVVEVPDEQQG
jgi:hypothetical protein